VTFLFEEMLLTVAPFVKTIHIANLYADAGPLCFEQLTVLREPPALGSLGFYAAEGPNSNCWVGFFSAYESQRSTWLVSQRITRSRWMDFCGDRAGS
jgi:hypothetical protein